jgi:hypothetical protein
LLLPDLISRSIHRRDPEFTEVLFTMISSSDFLGVLSASAVSHREVRKPKKFNPELDDLKS